MNRSRMMTGREEGWGFKGRMRMTVDDGRERERKKEIAENRGEAAKTDQQDKSGGGDGGCGGGNESREREVA